MITRPNARDLSAAMEFDACYRVHADGTMTDVMDAPYVEMIDGELSAPDGWRLMTGYTGQHGYNGPSMHSSEFIGGRMARDILETPGLYIVVADYPTGCAEGECEECEDGGSGECDHGSGEPDGWGVAFLPDEL